LQFSKGEGYVGSAEKVIFAFYEGHNRQLEKWHDVYNYVRPHQALAYLTPYEYYQS